MRTRNRASPQMGALRRERVVGYLLSSLMLRLRRIGPILGVLLLGAASAQGEAAASLSRVEPADLTGLRAKRPVEDSELRTTPRARAAAIRAETFVDDHGHRITLLTDIDGLDLGPYASVLAATLHYGEIQDLVTWVVEPAQVSAVCGPQADACYGPDPRSNRGEMVIPRSNDDLPSAHHRSRVWPPR